MIISKGKSFITIDEAMEELGVSRRMVFYYLQNGDLDRYKLRGRTLVLLSQVKSLHEPALMPAPEQEPQKVE